MLFSFSFQKLLVLAAVVAAVWYGFRYLNRWQAERERQAGFDKRQDAKKAEAKRSAKVKKPAIDAEEMVECKVCGAYVPATGHKNCGRSDCPY